MPSQSAATEPSPALLGSTAGEIFQLLREGQPWTKGRLALDTGLARSTVATRIDQLMAGGFVLQVSDTITSGGRPSAQYVFDPASRVVVAVDLGATHVLVAVTDLSGEVLAERRTDLDVTEGPEQVLALVVALAGELLTVAGRTADELAGVGIGLPAPVDHRSGTPVKPPIMPGWDRFDVAATIRRTFDVPVLVENDVNAMAVGERDRCWPGVDDLMFVKIATGIGAGVLSGGVLQRGSQGTAGDIGHVRVARASEALCRCGNLGCLEAIAAGPAIAASLSRMGHPAETGADVLQYAGSGNLQAIHALRQAGRDVGEVLAGAVNLLNPSVIVLGGDLAHAGEHLVAGVREVLYARCSPLATSELRIVVPRTGAHAAILGMCRLVVDEILSPAAIDAALSVAS